MGRLTGPALTLWIVVGLAACYGELFPGPASEPPDPFSGPADPDLEGDVALPEVPVEPGWLDGLAGLPADELFVAVAEELEVPDELLVALAVTETGLAPEARWLLPDPQRMEEAAELSQLSLTSVETDREAHLAAGAARPTPTMEKAKAGRTCAKLLFLAQSKPPSISTRPKKSRMIERP